MIEHGTNTLNYQNDLPYEKYEAYISLQDDNIMNHLILIQLVNFKPIDSSFKINAFSMAMNYSTRVR